MKNLKLMAIVLLFLPIHSSTFLNCSGDSDNDWSQKEGQKTPERTEENEGGKTMKLVLLDNNPKDGADIFYLRGAYNDVKDVILLYWVNYNGCISPKNIYLGSNTMTDGELMTSSNLIVPQNDSTSPLSGSQQYWCLFGQHGYLVPTIPNDMGLKSELVGTRWNDQLGRAYVIGNVTTKTVTLLPVIYQDFQGHFTREWRTNDSPAIKQLFRVDGSSEALNEISVSSSGSLQLYPIMQVEEREFIADGKPISSPGTFIIRELNVKEKQTGFNPATIHTWFPTTDLSSASAMARFYITYQFTDLQCSVHIQLDFLSEVEFQRYCGTQQQMFFDIGDYKAMFLIPKAAPQKGEELDKPFNSPPGSKTGLYFFRTPQYLKDVNQPIDRLVGFLHNEERDEYLFGMAAGLSLTSGDTRQEKRVESFPVGTDDTGRVGLFSPINHNKFYISAFSTATYSLRDYYVPAGESKEIDYYVSIYDPSANVGQVYWYKEGQQYVIYAHCQKKTGEVSLKMPAVMNDYHLEVVEKTDGTTLLSSAIKDSVIKVKYETDEANYIVLTARK